MHKLWRNWASHKVAILSVALGTVALATLNLLGATVALATLNLLGTVLICALIIRLSGSLGKAMSSRTPSDGEIEEKIAEPDNVSAHIVRSANETLDLLEKWANFLAAYTPARPTVDPASEKTTEQTRERIAELQRQGWEPDSIAGELKMSRDEAHLEMCRLRQSSN